MLIRYFVCEIKLFGKLSFSKIVILYPILINTLVDMRILMAMMDGRTVLMFGMSPFFVVSTECGLNFKNFVAKIFQILNQAFRLDVIK